MLILFVFCGGFGQKKEPEKIGEEGIIFAAIPARSNDYYHPFYEDILIFHKQLKAQKNVNDTVISLDYSETGYDDIWIRDIAPVATTRLVKFVYAPEYLPEEISRPLDSSFNDWLSDNQFEIYRSSLILDGGNLVWNKKDTVILTTRILEDNSERSRDEIITRLKTDLNVRTVILIPPETGDVLAHADGMVKFINESALFISDFSGDEAFRKQIETIILKEMPDAEFVVMPSAYTEQGQYDEEIASAKGLYINILETKSGWYVPQFRLPEDKEIPGFIQTYTDKQVIPLELEALSEMGGAVNCLTWYCPAEFIPPGFRN